MATKPPTSSTFRRADSVFKNPRSSSRSSSGMPFLPPDEFFGPLINITYGPGHSQRMVSATWAKLQAMTPPFRGSEGSEVAASGC